MQQLCPCLLLAPGAPFSCAAFVCVSCVSLHWYGPASSTLQVYIWDAYHLELVWRQPT